MNIHLLRKTAYGAAIAGLTLLPVGLLGGQMPQGQYPQGYPQGQAGQYPGQYPGANTPGVPNQPGSTMTDLTNDVDFAKEAAAGGMAEVKLGELAEQKGSSQAVRDFGKQMVEDHSAANEKLNAVAARQKLTLPAKLDKHDQKNYDRLSQLSGDAFDRAYAKDMVKDHQNDVAAFKQEASSGQNPAIKQFASETLPTLENHLKMAREMERTVNGGKSGGQ